MLLNPSLLVGAVVYSAVAVLADTTTSAAAPEPTEARPFMRHDYKQTFKKPYYYNHTIPFFDTFENTILSEDYIRLTSSVPGLTGSIWGKNPNTHPEWEVEFSFISSGRGNVGGEGLAFWYTKDRGQSGPVLGSKDKWDGLGIFFDTYDQAANRNSPYVYGIVNDGSKEFSPHRDPEKHKLGSCWRNYRNPSGPVFVRVSYYNKHLRVGTDTVQKGKSYVSCFEASNIELPKGYFFGFSAKAGDLPDDHDVFSFETYEVNPTKSTERHLRPHEEEKIKKDGAFTVSEESRKHIEEIQHKVEEVRHKEQEQRETQMEDTSHLAHSVQETQFRIIESLNALHSKLETLGAPAKPHEVPADIDARLLAISQSISATQTQVKSLNEILAGLTHHVSQIATSNSNTADNAKIAELQNTLKDISSRFGNLEMNRGSQVNPQSGDPVTTVVTIVPYVLLFLVVQGALMWFGGCWKPKAEGPKKFI